MKKLPGAQIIIESLLAEIGRVNEGIRIRRGEALERNG